MHTLVADTEDQFNQLGADLIAQVLTEKPDATILPATGNTPMGIYAALAERCRDGSLDASRARVFQLDEYLGLDDDDFRSLYDWTLRSFIDPLGIPHDHVTRLVGNDGDPQRACETYDAAVKAAGGIDLAIMGLGPNGHLAFNEPPSAPDAPTRVIDLSEESFVSNAVYWGGRDQVPRQAMTAGMDVILGARQVVLVVSGTRKQEVLARTMNGPVTPDVPSSWLQQVPNVTILADRDALPTGGVS